MVQMLLFIAIAIAVIVAVTDLMHDASQQHAPGAARRNDKWARVSISSSRNLRGNSDAICDQPSRNTSSPEEAVKIANVIGDLAIGLTIVLIAILLIGEATLRMTNRSVLPIETADPLMIPSPVPLL